MWKIAQPKPRTTATKLPNMPVAASSHNSRKMISPAYMLPNNRSECDSCLDTYSMKLNNRLKNTRNGDAHSGLTPNGAQPSSWIQPPSPLAAIENQIISSHTDNASANVVFTSAVGTRRNSWA